MSDPSWDIPEPFIVEEQVHEEDVDILGHTNNVTYLRWLEQAAWGHSRHLGLDMAAYEAENRAMVVHRHEIDYLGASYAGQVVRIGTWLVGNDGKLSLWRRYQIIRVEDDCTLVRGLTHFVCADLKSGRPKRMPPSFVEGYAPTVPDAFLHRSEA